MGREREERIGKRAAATRAHKHRMTTPKCKVKGLLTSPSTHTDSLPRASLTLLALSLSPLKHRRCTHTHAVCVCRRRHRCTDTAATRAANGGERVEDGGWKSLVAHEAHARSSHRKEGGREREEREKQRKKRGFTVEEDGDKSHVLLCVCVCVCLRVYCCTSPPPPPPPTSTLTCSAAADSRLVPRDCNC